MSLLSSNSHRNGAGNLHHGVFNPPAHCCCIETVHAGSWMTAAVSYAAVCSVGCDELSSDAARAHRWHPAGQPGLFFVKRRSRVLRRRTRQAALDKPRVHDGQLGFAILEH